MQPVVIFDRVSKAFTRGERHTSLRDLFPALIRSALPRRRTTELKEDQFWAIRDVSFEVRPGEAMAKPGAGG